MSARTRYEFFDEQLLGRLEQLHLIAKRLATRGRKGGRRSRRLGDGLEFADHRGYAPGDDIRFIDWPYYARMEKLLLRLFHEHSESEVAVLLDVSASMAPGGERTKFDTARRIAAAMAYVAMGSGEKVAIAPFAEDLSGAMHTGRTRGQIFEVLDFLASLEPGGQTDLPRSVERFLAGTARAAGTVGAAEAQTVLLVSDLLDCAEDLADVLGGLRHRGCDVTVLHVYSPADAGQAKPAGPVLLEHAETGGRIALDVTEQIARGYRHCWEAFLAGCRRTCLARGATYVAAPTDLPFERLVLQSLRQAGVLAG